MRATAEHERLRGGIGHALSDEGIIVGWQFRCPRCSWLSPVSAYLMRAARHEREHACRVDELERRPAA